MHLAVLVTGAWRKKFERYLKRLVDLYLGLPSNKHKKHERIIVKFSRQKDCKMYLTGRKKVEKVRHERNSFFGGQSYICEPKFVHILLGVMVKA